jgi:hypothetical protein
MSKVFQGADGRKVEVDVSTSLMRPGTFVTICTEEVSGAVGWLTPEVARAVAAEIIACADRIEGKESGGPPECSECHERRIQEDSDASANWTPTHVSTPTHTSHASLVVFAKAIAYLPQPMRDELNALLAQKLKEALK